MQTKFLSLCFPLVKLRPGKESDKHQGNKKEEKWREYRLIGLLKEGFFFSIWLTAVLDLQAYPSLMRPSKAEVTNLWHCSVTCYEPDYTGEGEWQVSEGSFIAIYSCSPSLTHHPQTEPSSCKKASLGLPLILHYVSCIIISLYFII